MNVFVGGPWDPVKAKERKEEMTELGKILGERGHDLTFGPGSGIVRYVLQGYKSVDEKKRGKVQFFVPHVAEMIRVGEEMKDFADEVIETQEDYLQRTVTMCHNADAFISIMGASGTLFEAIAMMFLKKPVAILKDVGTVGTVGQMIEGIQGYAHWATSVEDLVNYVEEAQEKMKDHVFEQEWYNV